MGRLGLDFDFLLSVFVSNRHDDLCWGGKLYELVISDTRVSGRTASKLTPASRV